MSSGGIATCRGPSPWVWATLILVGCPRTPSPSTEGKAPGLEIVGCTRSEPKECGLEPDTTAVIRLPGAASGRMAGQILRTQAGGRIAVPRPEQRSELVLEDTHRNPLARIYLAPLPGLPQDAALLERCAEDPNPWTAARCASKIGRQRLAAGDLRGAGAWFEIARTRYAAEGWIEPRIKDLLALAFHALWRHDELTLARSLLDEAGPLIEARPGARPRLEYYEGLWARRVGDLVEAEERLRQAEVGFRAWGLERLALGALEIAAVNAQDLGRGTRALQDLEAAGRALASPTPCGEARLESNVGWIRLLEQSRKGASPSADPRPSLSRALELYRSTCPRPSRRANALLNLGLAELAAGRLTEARRLAGELAKTSTQGLGISHRSWAFELQARLSLEAGELRDARRHFEAMRERAAEIDPTLAWRAWLGLGDVGRRAGRWAEAFGAYQMAEQALGRATQHLPLDQTRSDYLLGRGRSLSGLVEAGVAAGQLEAVFCAVLQAQRRGRADLAGRQRISAWRAAERQTWTAELERYLQLRRQASRDASLDWGRSAAELSEARRSRAAVLEQAQAKLRKLMQLPTPENGRGAADCGAAPEHGGELVMLPGASRRLLFRTAAGTRIVTRAKLSASPVVIYPGALSPLRELANALAIQGTRVRWALGLEAVGSSPPRPSAGRTPRALVVADPSRDLKTAEDEGRQVAESYRKGGFEVTLLVGEAASWEAVRKALTQVTVFHYAGHGGRSADRWGGDALRLAGEARLTAADLLLLPRAPRFAVLNGCRTAAEPGVGLSLTEALLMAGTRRVVASPRATSDRGSAGLGICLARELASERLRASDGYVSAAGRGRRGGLAAGSEGGLAAAWSACASAESRAAGYELWQR